MGEGLRHYAEGRYDEAVTSLFQAYGAQPDARTMKMIVRSYDLMGRCDAAQRQLELYREEHPSAGTMALQRCAQSEQVTLDCAGSFGELRLNGMIEARCGEPLRLAAGEYRITGSGLERAREVSVSPGAPQVVRLELKPRKWPVARLEGHNAAVERLPMTRDRYTVIMARDGLYHIWTGDEAGKGMLTTCRDASGERTCTEPTPSPSPAFFIPRID